MNGSVKVRGQYIENIIRVDGSVKEFGVPDYSSIFFYFIFLMKRKLTPPPLGQA